MSIAMANSATADEIYTVGPETLVARSASILAGALSSYGKQVLETSQPPGPDAMPLKWVVTGRVDSARVVKGQATGPVSFSKTEYSVFLPYGGGEESWESEYGEFRERGEAVLFLGGDPARSVIKALPSGGGEQDLTALVTDIVAVQKLPTKESREAGWSAYLGKAAVDEGRKAALRSLVNAPMEWNRLEPALSGFMADRGLSELMRAFAFGIVAYGLTKGYWAASGTGAGDFLCRIFQGEERPRLLMQHILALRQVLVFAMEETHRSAREPLRSVIVGCLRRKEGAVSGEPDVVQQYNQIRRTYPGLL